MVNYVAGEEAATEIVRDIEDQGGRAMAVKADVGDEKEVREMYGALLERFSTLDILVSNAGIQIDSPFVEMTLADWEKVVKVNLTGAFLCAREAVREFLRRGVVPERSRAAGKIIFTSSVHEVIPWAGHANYAASKGGVMLLMKSSPRSSAPPGFG